jgi:phosphoribosylaminoimidazole carboxylase (NCAIR synthetase)
VKGGLLAPPPEAVAVFRDKAVAYEAARAIGVPVPPWWRVRTAGKLLAAVEELEARGYTACFKPASGAGGGGQDGGVGVTVRGVDLDGPAAGISPQPIHEEQTGW